MNYQNARIFRQLIPKFVKQKIEEKNKIEEEIRKLHRNLEQKNIEIQTIDEHRKLEEELQKYGLSVEPPRKLVSVLLKINRLEYDALKILKELA